MGKGLMGKFQFGELKKFQRPAVQPCKHTTLFNCKVLKTVKSFTLCVVFIKKHNSKTNKTSNKRGRSYGVAYFVLFIEFLKLVSDSALQQHIIQVLAIST